MRVANDFPIWALTQNQDLRSVNASYAQSLANRNARTIRNRIASPRIGLQIASDNGSVSEWQLNDLEGGVLYVGAGVTGRPADKMFAERHIKRTWAQREPQRSQRPWRLSGFGSYFGPR